MINTLSRKLSQLRHDPVLRRWLVGRLVGRYPGEPSYLPHRPPYLNENAFAGPAGEQSVFSFPILDRSKAPGAIDLPLPGYSYSLCPGEGRALFEFEFEDLETRLAVQRFAWLPLVTGLISPGWVQELWTLWYEMYGQPDNDWNWHPYTAAERAINILTWSARFGLPEPRGETLSTLEIHGDHILNNLEYFGDHHTSNHLSNNGRGLYALGLYLGSTHLADVGSTILVNEAERIFLPSGILREGSSHYHLLLTRNYLFAWLLAEKFGRPEKSQLRQIASNCLAVNPHLSISGHVPLIGDISPDCPPGYLSDSSGQTENWRDTLDDNDRAKLADLEGSVPPLAPETLAEDGWHRFGLGPWHGIWRAQPNGWTTMPGHGHEDCMSFVLNYEGEAIFVDPGRGSYNDTSDANFYKSALAHNSVLVDGQSPFPPNKPYYNDAFRKSVCGPGATLHCDENAIEICHSGFQRISGVKNVCRRWVFDEKRLTILDTVDGKGRRRISQNFVTSNEVLREKGAIILRSKHHQIRISPVAGELNVRPIENWIEYGKGTPANLITMERDARLPYRSETVIEVL